MPISATGSRARSSWTPACAGAPSRATRAREGGFTPLRRFAENGFTPFRLFAENGFTLVELMVVIGIIGLAAAAVVVAMPDPRGSLRADAERFAARARAAQDAAVIEAHDIALDVRADGYGFERLDHGRWRPLAATPFADQRWAGGATALVGDAGRARVIFDTTGAGAPLDVTLVRDAERIRIHLDTDGTIRVAS